MDDVSNYIRVTLPEAAVMLLDHNVLDAVTKAAGGVSVTKSYGQWFGEGGVLHEDKNDVFQWNYYPAGSPLHEPIMALLRNVFASTNEESVLVESVTYEQYTAEIYYKEDV